MKLRADTIFFKIGLVIWLPILVMGSWFAKIGYSLFGDVFSCVLYEWSGLPCPGCGGTRAVVQFFLGNFLQSFSYHPAVISAIICYLHFMFKYMFKHVKHPQKNNKEIHVEYYIYFLTVIIILQWIIKILLIIF